MPKLLKGNSRQYFNIHTITTDIESKIRNKTYSKNMELMCMNCGHVWITAYDDMRAVYCPKCRYKYWVNRFATNIRDATLSDEEIRKEGSYRINYNEVIT